MNVQAMTMDMNSLRPPQQTNTHQVASNKEDQFSSVLDKSREKQEAPVKEKTSKDKVSKENDQSNKVSPDKTEVVESKKSEVTKEVEETGQTKETTLEDDLLVQETTVEAMAAIAQLLGVTTQDLEQMLGNLQIELTDLLEGNNLQELIMAVHGAEEAVDLLQIPDLGATIKDITSVLEDYTANLKELGYDLNLATAVETEAVIKPEISVNLQNHNNLPKDMIKDSQVETNSQGIEVEVKAETIAKPTLAAQSSEEPSQNEEQAGPQQNPANQFLDKLSHSMGEVFQSQTGQVNEAFDATLSRTKPVNPRMVLDQIVEKIKVTSFENEAQMTIQLKPEHLGKLSMEVVSKQGILTAHITVENEKTKAMLDQNIQSLRDDLEAKGLVIQELEVAVGQNQNQDRPGYEGRKSNRNISNRINQLMNEEIEMATEEVEPDNVFDHRNEVDFIA